MIFSVFCVHVWIRFSFLIQWNCNQWKWIYPVHLNTYQGEGGDDAPVQVLMKADLSCRESLQTEAEVDPMDGEQTWPTESELQEAKGA